MLTSEALRYCNNRIQEIANKTYYNNEQIQTLRNIIESLFGYVNKGQLKDINLEIFEDWNETPGYIYVEIEHKDNYLALDINCEYIKDSYWMKPNIGAFDLHNINKLFDWVFTDEN